MLKFSETIRRWMGWCPCATMPVERRPATDTGFPYLPGAGDLPPSAGRTVAVDCHFVSPRVLLATLLAFAAFFLLFAISFFLPEWRSGFYLLMGLAFVAYAAVHAYLDRKLAVMEFLEDSIVIRRPIFGPLVIKKGFVRSITVQKTNVPVSPRVLAVLCLLLDAAVVLSMIHNDLFRFVSGQAPGPDAVFRFLFVLGFAAFLMELCYRSFARLHYPGFVKVTLASGETVHLYAENPGELAARVGGYA